MYINNKWRDKKKKKKTEPQLIQHVKVVEQF